MLNYSDEISIPSVKAIKNLLDPIFKRLDHIESLVSKKESKIIKPRYYRNSDLKTMFGLSNNTIIKYRETGILPYTSLGEIYLYDAHAIDLMLKRNHSQ